MGRLWTLSVPSSIMPSWLEQPVGATQSTMNHKSAGPPFSPAKQLGLRKSEKMRMRE